MKNLKQKVSGFFLNMGKRATNIKKMLKGGGPTGIVSTSGAYIWNPGIRNALRPRPLGLAARSPFGLLGLAAAVVVVCNPSLWAYGDDIVAAGNNLYTFMRVLGGVMFLVGAVKVGYHLMQHDREAWSKGSGVLIGGLVVLLAPALLNLLQELTSGAAKTATWN